MKENDRYKFFLFPFIAGQGLDELLGKRKQNQQPFLDDEISDFAKQMAQAVIDMHNAGVIHQDIKPRNIRITPEGKFVIVDLGIARFKKDGKRGIGRGAYGYSSPEQIRGALGIETPITFSADHWAIGIIVCMRFHYIKIKTKSKAKANFHRIKMSLAFWHAGIE